MAVPYLQIDNLTKSFGDLVLFENISFGIAEGQRVGLIAKNGSGKSTLLNIIAFIMATARWSSSRSMNGAWKPRAIPDSMSFSHVWTRRRLGSMSRR